MKLRWCFYILPITPWQYFYILPITPWRYIYILPIIPWRYFYILPITPWRNFYNFFINIRMYTIAYFFFILSNTTYCYWIIYFCIVIVFLAGHWFESNKLWILNYNNGSNRFSRTKDGNLTAHLYLHWTYTIHNQIYMVSFLIVQLIN